MWTFLTICTVLAVIKNSEAGKLSNSGKANGGAYAGAVSSGSANSYIGGYGGGSSGGGYTGGGGGFNDYDYGGDFGGGLGFGGIPDPYVFHQQLMASILRQHAAHQNAIVSATSTGDASVNADASFISDNDDQESINRQNPQIGVKRFGGSKIPQNNGASGSAYAAGSIGPGGFKQTAYINPANPASPNIMNRFGASDSNGGYKAVSVSSFSHSSDVNGKRQNVRGSQTTVNDNGKISTYSVHS